MKNIRKQLYCIYFNKVAFVGTLLAMVPIAIYLLGKLIPSFSEIIEASPRIIIMLWVIECSGHMLLMVTTYGMGTRDTFNKSEKFIIEHGERAAHLLEKKYKFYCDKAGVRAAMYYCKKYHCRSMLSLGFNI